MSASVTNIWDMLDKDSGFYALIDQSMLLIEPEEDVASVRLFLNSIDAKAYKKEAIEKNDLRPSQVKIGRLPLKDVFDLKEELTVIALECYDKPLKIVVAQMYKDFVISEEEIFNSAVQLH